MSRKHIQTAGIGDVVIAIAAIIFVAVCIFVSRYGRRIKTASGPWITDQTNERPEK